MLRMTIHLIGLGGVLLLTGCASPKFDYKAPPACLNPSGPSLLVMPLTDGRTNRDMDEVLAKGYLADVQLAIGNELQSMNLFSAVMVVTNDAKPLSADYQLNPTLRRLDWEIPHYKRLEGEAFAIGLLTGLVGGGVFLVTSVDVHGNSSLDVVLQRGSDGKALLNLNYSDTVTNRLKKAVCDTPDTQAKMMVQAFQKTMGELKVDLQKELSQGASTNAVAKSATGKN